MKTKVFLHLFLAVVILGLVGCQTTRSKGGFAKKTSTWDRKRGISDSDLPTPGWWHARRDYDRNYMHWGKMRHPDAPAKSEKWVLLNEDQCKAPHRSLGRVSADNGREYRFYGFFMEDRGYEPAADELCQIFVLQKWEPLNPPKREAAMPEAQAQAQSNEPPPKPEAEEQAAPPVPAQAVTANAAPVQPKVKPAAAATNATTQVKPKPAATNTMTKTIPKPAAKKKTPSPAPVQPAQ